MRDFSCVAKRILLINCAERFGEMSFTTLFTIELFWPVLRSGKIPHLITNLVLPATVATVYDVAPLIKTRQINLEN